jgi:hypothetical protein
MQVPRRHLFRSPRTETAAGLGAFALGWWFLYQAYDRRGRDQPRLLRPFTWW